MLGIAALDFATPQLPGLAGIDYETAISGAITYALIAWGVAHQVRYDIREALGLENRYEDCL